MVLLGMDLVMAPRAEDDQMRERFMGNEVVGQVMDLAASVRPRAQLAADAAVLTLDLAALLVPLLGPARPLDVIGIGQGVRLATDQLGPIEEEKLAIVRHWRLLS